MADTEEKDPVSPDEIEREVAKGEAFKLAQAMKEAVDGYFEKHEGLNEHAVLFGALAMLFDHMLRTSPNTDMRVRHGLIDGFADVMHHELNHPSDNPRLN